MHEDQIVLLHATEFVEAAKNMMSWLEVANGPWTRLWLCASGQKGYICANRKIVDERNRLCNVEIRGGDIGREDCAWWLNGRDCPGCGTSLDHRRNQYTLVRQDWLSAVSGM